MKIFKKSSWISCQYSAIVSWSLVLAQELKKRTNTMGRYQ